jgi:hypothetical protein
MTKSSFTFGLPPMHSNKPFLCLFLPCQGLQAADSLHRPALCLQHLLNYGCLKLHSNGRRVVPGPP